MKLEEKMVILRKLNKGCISRRRMYQLAISRLTTTKKKISMTYKSKYLFYSPSGSQVDKADLS